MPEEKVHKCFKCGKTKKPGDTFQHLGKLYCCDKCCKREDTPQNVCEFC